jgi:hypothetical protein
VQMPAAGTAPGARAPPCKIGATGLWVERVTGLAALEQFAADIDRLNALGSQHNPFLSASFLRCYAHEAEYYTPGEGERLYLIREGAGARSDQLIGIAPLRLSLEKVIPPIGWKGGRLTVLAPLDTDRPGILCAPDDEARVAAALIEHLCLCERDWGLLEFASQLPGTPLHGAMHAAANEGYRARDVHVEPFNEIPIAWGDLSTYFRSLAKKMRSNISRQVRKLFASGAVEIVLAEGAPAVSGWFDAYCDLDGRSWKQGTQSSIQRHPRRVSFYRQIAAGGAGLEPSFIGILLEGVLVAGLLSGSNSKAAPAHHGSWCLEMAYDRTRAELGPGQLLLLVAMGEAIGRGDRFLNYLQNFAYYKHRWGAKSIPVANVQLLRKLSAHYLRATVGDLVKRLREPRRTRGPAAITEREEPMDHSDAAAAQRAGVVVARGRTGGSTDLAGACARNLAARALDYAGPGVRRLDREQAQRYLPFDLGPD